MMNKLILSIALPFCIACGSQAQEHSHGDHDHSGHNHEVTQDAVQKPGHYGKEITAEDAISTTELMAAMEGKDSMDCKVNAKIITSCKKKGCWMDVMNDDGSTMKVTFIDYGFFVPTEGLEGKTVIMQGTAKREVVDVEMLRHYAEDAGKSKEEIEAITEPEQSIAFIATGVIIQD